MLHLKLLLIIELLLGNFALPCFTLVVDVVP
jgi:hypothetical protein